MAKTFKGGQTLREGLHVVHLAHMKSPGESAFYLNAEGGVVFIGDAVIGREPGKLSLLPESKVPRPERAKASLKALLALEFRHLLIGDGYSILHKGKEALREFLSAP